MIRNSELWGGLFWLAIGAFVISAGRDMGLGRLHQPRTRVSPSIWIGILMCALALGVIGQALACRRRRRWPRSGPARAGARCWW